MKEETKIETPDQIPTPKEWQAVTDNDLDAVVSNMPTPIPDAIEAAQVKDAAASNDVKDPKGRLFDPAIHQTDAAGKPLLTPTGRFKSKIRLPKQTTGINLPTEQPLAVPEYRAVARTLVGLFIQTGYALVGDEWLPEKTKDQDEEQNLISATENYCASTGFRDLPPGIIIAVAFIGYGLRRIGKPRTRNLVEKSIVWVKTFATNTWIKITGQKIKIVPTEK